MPSPTEQAPRPCDCGRPLQPIPDHPTLWGCNPCGTICDFTHYTPDPTPQET